MELKNRFTKNPNPTKLPRKRKKAYIKEHGKVNYRASRLYSINQNEYKAKFWKGYAFRATFGGGMEVVPTGFW